MNVDPAWMICGWALSAQIILFCITWTLLRTEWYRSVAAMYCGIYFACCTAGLTGWDAWLNGPSFFTLCMAILTGAWLAAGVIGLRRVARMVREDSAPKTWE